jgi:hypothetical protein
VIVPVGCRLSQAQVGLTVVGEAEGEWEPLPEGRELLEPEVCSIEASWEGACVEDAGGE